MTAWAIGFDLPPVGKDIGGNARGHWRKRHRLFQEAKQTAMTLMRAELNEHGLYGEQNLSPVAVSVVWLYTNAAHRPDFDNMASRIKPYLDAAKDVGLIPDDGPKHVVRITYEYQRSGRTGIRMTFTRLAQEGQDAA